MPRIHKALGSTPKQYKPGMMVHTYNSALGRPEDPTFKVPKLYDKLEANLVYVKPCLNFFFSVLSCNSYVIQFIHLEHTIKFHYIDRVV